MLPFRISFPFPFLSNPIFREIRYPKNLNGIKQSQISNHQQEKLSLIIFGYMHPSMIPNFIILAEFNYFHIRCTLFLYLFATINNAFSLTGEEDRLLLPTVCHEREAIKRSRDHDITNSNLFHEKSLNRIPYRRSYEGTRDEN